MQIQLVNIRSQTTLWEGEVVIQEEWWQEKEKRWKVRRLKREENLNQKEKEEEDCWWWLQEKEKEEKQKEEIYHDWRRESIWEFAGEGLGRYNGHLREKQVCFNCRKFEN